MIPIKGYSRFQPLKHCWIGSGFKAEWFKDLSIGNNDKIMSPLTRIAEETEEDYQTLEKILKDAGVKTYRSFLDIDKYESLHNIKRPPTCPRDHFAVVGETLYSAYPGEGYADVLKQIHRKNLHITTQPCALNTAVITRLGKDLWWDVDHNTPEAQMIKYKTLWEEQGFRVHITNKGYHMDGAFSVLKPGCIVSLHDVYDYSKDFPGWEVLYLPDQSWVAMDGWQKQKLEVAGRWWLQGEEQNDQLIEFINAWLDDWVGFVEETVFDVNMLSIDQNTVICNNYNKEVFEFFKKHKIEPIVFNFRHRYFWDGGVHCITQDLYREGEMEDYFG